TIFRRPWLPPKRSIVETVNTVSQYGAWVLIHGYSVNHFTGYINRQNTPQYPDIETTALGLAKLGIPMKAEIEGSSTTGLRQTATKAVTEMVSVQDDETLEIIQIPWTYAYYEIAERHLVSTSSGKTLRFAGFLDSQAKNLFEMTRL
ncbi:2-oxoadipate dioxygenase/decarboxylase family protein, partial [Merismopedia glauca]